MYFLDLTDILYVYPTLAEKAAALCYSLISNHPFVDGNKRASHAVMVAFLKCNGYELIAHVDEQEKVVLELASGNMERTVFSDWVQHHLKLRA